jgi:exosortase/archaeosortase family protein
VDQAGPYISAPHLIIQVDWKCTAILYGLGFATGILAFPASWRSRGIGLLGGCSIILSLNIIRILVVFLVGLHFPGMMAFSHDVAGEVLMIAGTASVWAAWTRGAANRLTFVPGRESP